MNKYKFLLHSYLKQERITHIKKRLRKSPTTTLLLHKRIK